MLDYFKITFQIVHTRHRVGCRRVVQLGGLGKGSPDTVPLSLKSSLVLTGVVLTGVQPFGQVALEKLKG